VCPDVYIGGHAYGAGRDRRSAFSTAASALCVVSDVVDISSDWFRSAATICCISAQPSAEMRPVGLGLL
jgi:hypothetical protein